MDALGAVAQRAQYAKAAGSGNGLDELRDQMSRRFHRRAASSEPEATAGNN